MKNFSNRLDRIEKALIPDERFALCFVRYDHEEEDFTKQQAEFVDLYGSADKANFITVVDYADEPSYEAFIDKRRRTSAKGNVFAWWPEFPSPE